MESMDMFERYLQAVRKYLPWQRQDDIIAELRANLDAQREEREAELGRPLTEGEMIDWLKELGPPLQVAGRYQPPRYLIGPAVFPLYLYVLRLVCFWASIGYGISVVVRLFIESHAPEWVGGQLAAYPGILITCAAWVTGAFAAVEFYAQRNPEKWCWDFGGITKNWSPASLPPLQKAHPAGSKPRSLTTAVAEVVVGFVLLIWLLLIPHYPWVLLGPGAAFLKHSPVRLAEIVLVFYWAIVVFNVIQLAWQTINLVADNWRFQSKAQNLVTKGLGLIPILILLGAPEHQILELNPDAGRLPVGFDLATVNRGIFQALTLLALIVGIQFVWAIWKAGERKVKQHLQAAM